MTLEWSISLGNLIALGVLICDVILTALALWRACNAVHEIREIAERMDNQ